ncbi:MAG: glycosyltransferase family 87 protein [Phycisphaerales bacterium]|nr:DUF2029 domain-containing protein [Planctomycetota bacterium]
MAADAQAQSPLRSRLEPHLSRIAVILWIVLLAAAVGRGLFLHGQLRHTGEGFMIFLQAGEHWRAGENLYQPGDSLRAFRNSPLVGAAFGPLSALPGNVASALLRLISFSSVVIGLWLLVSTFIAPRFRTLARPWIFLLAIVLCMQPLGDAQTNGLSAGLIAMGAALVARGRFWPAAFALVLAVHVKAYPVALLMLFVALFPRRMILPVIVAGLATFLATFLFQKFEYVQTQWGDWIRYGLNNRQGPGGQNVFRDIRTLLQVLGIPCSPQAYLILEAATGLLLCVYVLWLRPRVTSSRLLVTTYTLAVAWMTVLGPATESQTYIHLAPACALVVWLTWSSPDRLPDGLFALSGWTLIAITQVALWFPRGSSTHQLGLHAAGALLVAAATILWSLRNSPQEQLA